MSQYDSFYAEYNVSLTIPTNVLIAIKLLSSRDPSEFKIKSIGNQHCWKRVTKCWKSSNVSIIWCYCLKLNLFKNINVNKNL